MNVAISVSWSVMETASLPPRHVKVNLYKWPEFGVVSCLFLTMPLVCA